MGTETVKSLALTNLDSTPVVTNTAAQGAAGRLLMVDDFVAATATGLGTAGSYYRLCRVPTGAIPKRLRVATDKAPDAASGKTVAFDLSFIFSDSTIDGTQAALQGLIPTTGNTGNTVTVVTYTGANKVFGTFIETSNTAAYGPTDLTMNGIGTAYPISVLFNQPLWQTFGFVDGRGNPADPGGYFDLLVYVSTAATTAQACNLYASLEYAI